MRFLVHGSVAYDLLLSHDGSFLSGIDPKALDNLSVNYLAHGFVRHHGGTAANVAWNLRLLGHAPAIVSAVGSDGDEYIDLLSKHGIDVSLVEKRTDAMTATAVIATDSDERQISFFHPGADGLAGLPDVSKYKDAVYAIISPRNPMLMLQGADQCAKAGIPYLFDPGQVVHAFGRDEFRRAIEKSAGLIVNEYEWSLASASLGWKEKDVVSACGMLVVTLSEKGLKILTTKETVEIHGAKAKKVVNPTGAGDAARAGLLVGLASKWSLADAGRLAAVMGSMLVEQEGTLLQSFDLEEVQNRAKKAYGASLPF